MLNLLLTVLVLATADKRFHLCTTIDREFFDNTIRIIIITL
ncbi:MAG: hypothetical protein WBH76_01025 [Dictyoglomaceae bacterium]